MAVPISVVIPLGPNESAWRRLLTELKLPDDSEVILAARQIPDSIERAAIPQGVALKISTRGQGRAEQMNAGAELAQHSWLWFLHADSQPAPDAFPVVDRITSEDLTALYYFDLKFMKDGPVAMRWNERAVKWRSDLLKIPFGDQGFLIRRDLFLGLGGYREDVAYGEDHLLTWKVRQEGYKVLPAGAKIFTSARKYRDNGWVNTTARHVWLTVKQAVPQWIELLKRRYLRMGS